MKLTLFQVTLIAFILSPISCKQTENSANLKHLVDTELTDEKVQKALEAEFAIKINLTTNKLSYYRSGELQDQWNIASADVTGAYHKVDGKNEKQMNITGIFTAHDIEHCPSWYPRKPFDPVSKKYVEDPEERLRVFKGNQSLYGPCGKSNPLGSYAMWFSGTYGLHGTTAEYILARAVEDRRVSGGCIRNPNAKIKKIFDEIVEKLPAYRKKVDANIAAKPGEKETVTAKEISDKVLVHVIVGNWDKDPEVNLLKECVVKFVSPNSGKLEIYEQNPLKKVIDYYEKGEKVLVLETIAGVFKTEKGFVNKNYFSDCKNILLKKQPNNADKNEDVEKTGDAEKTDDVSSGAEIVPTPEENSTTIGDDTSSGSEQQKVSYLKTCIVKYVTPQGILEVWGQSTPLANKIGSYSKGDKVDIIETVDGVGKIYKTELGYVNGHYLGDCKDY